MKDIMKANVWEENQKMGEEERAFRAHIEIQMEEQQRSEFERKQEKVSNYKIF